MEERTQKKSQLNQPLQEMSQSFSQAQVSFIAVAKYCFPAYYFSSSFLGLNANPPLNVRSLRTVKKPIVNKKGKEKDYIGLMQIHYFASSILGSNQNLKVTTKKKHSKNEQDLMNFNDGSFVA